MVGVGETTIVRSGCGCSWAGGEDCGWGSASPGKRQLLAINNVETRAIMMVRTLICNFFILRFASGYAIDKIRLHTDTRSELGYLFLT